jgi:hypothetical protein
MSEGYSTSTALASISFGTAPDRSIARSSRDAKSFSGKHRGRVKLSFGLSKGDALMAARTRIRRGTRLDRTRSAEFRSQAPRRNIRFKSSGGNLCRWNDPPLAVPLTPTLSCVLRFEIAGVVALVQLILGLAPGADDLAKAWRRPWPSRLDAAVRPRTAACRPLGRNDPASERTCAELRRPQQESVSPGLYAGLRASPCK